MPTKIKIRQNKDGKNRYRALYLAPDGRWITTGTFGDRRTAVKAATLAEAEAGTQRWVDPRRGKITFASFVAQAYEPTMGTLEATTRRGYHSMLRTHLLPKWGDRPLVSIRPSEIGQWVSDPFPPRAFPANRPKMAERPRSPQKAVDAYALFRKILDLAVHDGVLTSNPCVGIKLPTQPELEVKIITPEEFDLLLEKILVRRADGSPTEVSIRNQAILLTAALTGLRWSELVALCPAQVDFLAKRITVNRGLVLVGKAETGNDSRWMSKPYPKGKRTRIVPLDDEAGDVLSSMIAKRSLGPKSEEPIFVTRVGTPISSTSYVEDVLKPAVKEAGLEGRGITIKTLRASYCSWLLAGGAPLADVQALMGHQQLTTTQKYVQILPEAYDTALTALSAIRHRSR